MGKKFQQAATLHVRDCTPTLKEQVAQVVGAVLQPVLEPINGRLEPLVAIENKEGDVLLGYWL